MIVKMFSVYDSKADFFSKPFFVQSKGEAIRSFTEAANDKSSQIGKYPEDFGLFYIGEFNDSNAQFILAKIPEPIGLALEFVREKYPPPVPHKDVV